ncbi:hypothetical protein CC1G_12032 [Coprinopsis cinerea okayama7|uniref:Uncharacterized protein n=1 Tax=Coprinopsis cinerea (strain Okayama-7 / 130 / ATCC MYA-4618 / FGSC 9003) TaxID=240176 RepID=A8P8H4_COPC7|nr:hypothetical protein CC1G_12032 [Coprinopsis cinerea okayama7\|eukprot:XP_001839569.1 hypothetical protein CC1G_12032 [Coprinopsis cinerea okayama7\
MPRSSTQSKLLPSKIQEHAKKLLYIHLTLSLLFSFLGLIFTGVLHPESTPRDTLTRYLHFASLLLGGFTLSRVTIIPETSGCYRDDEKPIVYFPRALGLAFTLLSSVFAAAWLALCVRVVSEELLEFPEEWNTFVKVIHAVYMGGEALGASVQAWAFGVIAVLLQVVAYRPVRERQDKSVQSGVGKEV